MKPTSIFSISKPKGYLNLLLWIFLIVFGGSFILKDALPYFGFSEEIFGRWWPVKWSLIGHVAGGLIAIVIGPFQFWKAFRNKYLKTHRWLGRSYLIAITIGAISATHLAWTTALAVHWSWALALQTLAFAWIVTAGMAYISIRRRRIQIHKEWMIRSYVVTFAFVTFRWLTNLPVVENLGSFIEYGPTAIWVSWAIPLLVTEVCINWNKK